MAEEEDGVGVEVVMIYVDLDLREEIKYQLPQINCEEAIKVIS